MCKGSPKEIGHFEDMFLYKNQKKGKTLSVGFEMLS